MPISGQVTLQDSKSDLYLLADFSNPPPPLPPRKPIVTPVKLSVEEHRNDQSKARMSESFNLMTFPDNDEDPDVLTTGWETCDGNAFDRIIAECSLLNNSDNSDNSETDEMGPGLQTNVSSGVLDKYFEDPLFQSSFDGMELETNGKRYSPDFGKDIDDISTSNEAYLPLPAKDTNQNSIFTDPTENTTHVANILLHSSKSTMVEDKSGSGNSEQSRALLKDYFRRDSIYHPDYEKQTTVGNVQGSDTDSDTPMPSSQHKYIIKLRELEQEVNQLELLQRNKSTAELGKTPALSNSGHKKLSPQRSVSESDIYNFITEDDKPSKGSTNEWHVIKDDINVKAKQGICNKIKHEHYGIQKSPSLENIKSVAQKVWGKISKRENIKSDTISPKLKIKVDAHVELSCPCEGSCRLVGRLVAASGGYMWVSFSKCSWVALYNYRNVRVYTFDTRGCVDSLAVTDTGVLYVSCPLQKRILMLSTNLELTILKSFNTLYPRGLAISPDDKTVVVCMTSQAVGYVMDAPSRNSCLMRFRGQTPNESGTVVHKGQLGYPVKVIINVNGVLLVSDFGLKRLCVLDKGGLMLRTFYTLGDAPLCLVPALTCNPVNSFFVVQGGRGTLSITRLGDYQGTFEEKSTSKKDVTCVVQNVETSSLHKNGQIVLASGNILTFVSLMS